MDLTLRKAKNSFGFRLLVSKAPEMGLYTDEWYRPLRLAMAI